MLVYIVLSSDGILCKDVMMLNFFPELSESEFSSNHEFIFVIDRSGSYYWTLLSFTATLFYAVIWLYVVHINMLVLLLNFDSVVYAERISFFASLISDYD